MSNFPAKIQQIIDENYEFRFGDYISRGFTLMGRNPGGFIGFFLIFIVISLVLAVIPILGTLISLVISPALSIGPYNVAGKVDRNESNEFGDFFKGFDRLWPLFLTSILTGLIVIAAALPGLIIMFAGGFSLLEQDEPSSLMWVGMLLMILPAIYLGVSYVFAPMFVWFYEMEPWPAMEASRKIVSKQWFMVLLFLFAVGLIAMAGLILLGVGILYTLPAMICALYAAFADVSRLNEASGGEADLIDHFVPTER